MATLPTRHIHYIEIVILVKIGAANETRTRDIHVGNVMLYQLSYSRFMRALLFTSQIVEDMVPGAGLEPARFSARDFKSLVSTNSTTRA